MPVTVYIDDRQSAELTAIAEKFDLRWGGKPSKSALIRAIADRTLEVCKPEYELMANLTQGGLFSQLINTDAPSEARRYAGLAQALIKADCHEEAEPYIRLGLTYALIAASESG